MSEFVDYYAMLQVHPEASPVIIDRAYKALIFEHHPDRGGNPDKAKDIIGAHYVLSDADRRREYDSKYRAHQASRVTPQQAREAVVIDEIPPEVIDAILARGFVEGAAATARTAARVAGAVAVVGAVSTASAVAAGFDAVVEGHQRRSDEKWANKERERLAEIHRREDRQLDLQAQRTAEGWSPAPSKAAVTLFRKSLEDPHVFLGDLTRDELLWFAVRHPYAPVRRRAFSSVWYRVKDGRMLIGTEDAWSAPVLVAAGPEGFEARLKLGPLNNITSASLMTDDEYTVLCKATGRKRAVRTVLLTALALAGVLAAVGSQSGWFS